MASAYLFRGDRLLRSFVQLFNCLRVVTEILFASNQNNGQALAKMQDFRDPLKVICQNPFTWLDAANIGAGHTFSCTLSKESGESTAKQMRMT